MAAGMCFAVFYFSPVFDSSRIVSCDPFFICFLSSNPINIGTIGKLSSLAFQRYLRIVNPTPDEGVMSQSSQGVGSVREGFRASLSRPSGVKSMP